MIDALVKAAEKITELLKYREQRKEKRWKTLIEPTFISLQAVHKDYLKVFDEVRVSLAAGTKCAAILSTLQTRRVEQEASRRTLEHMADITAERDDLSKSEKQFFRDICSYFRYEPLRTLSKEPRTASVISSLGRQLEEAARIEPLDPEKAKELASEALKDALHTIRNNWVGVAKQCATLQAELGIG